MIELSITRRVIQDWLVERFAAHLGVPEEQIAADAYIDELPLDSVDAVAVVVELERWFGRQLDVWEVRRHPTIGELADFLAREYARRPAVPNARPAPAA
uniref:Acyl-carrier protein n=1 Tax=Streptomyces sp. UC 11065 TaxID=428401 RepID=A3R4T2_9ACTN|nr:acyl-carrier protein [Streptomyces sp. UC 11065]